MYRQKLYIHVLYTRDVHCTSKYTKKLTHGTLYSSLGKGSYTRCIQSVSTFKRTLGEHSVHVLYTLTIQYTLVIDTVDTR